jgi:hypothetical protein
MHPLDVPTLGCASAMLGPQSNLSTSTRVTREEGRFHRHSGDPMAGSLNGKVALLTGAVRRNGRASAHALAQDGAAIVINARNSADEARKLQGEIEAFGGKALVCLADITDEAAVARMFGEIDKRFGRVDILVNNAADRARTPFTEMTYAQWRHFTGIILASPARSRTSTRATTSR